MADFRPIQIGKYLLLEPIGGGGMGVVYRGKLLGAGKFSKEIAIKCISPAATSDPEVKAMFEAEASICSRLNHPNIISVFDFSNTPQGFLMAMEFVRGKNLKQISHFVKKGGSKMSVETVLYIINEVCKGLDYAHSLCNEEGKNLMLLHRDISPQNIMVSYEGAVKLVDFGIAKTRDVSDLTKLGTLKGKVSYMSPEQASGMTLNQATDVFSLGIVLYELLTNKRLFKGESDREILVKVTNAKIIPPSQSNPEVPPELDQIVMRALAASSYERYQNGGQFSDAISHYLASKGSLFNSRTLSKWMREQFAVDFEKENEISLMAMNQSFAEPEVKLENTMKGEVVLFPNSQGNLGKKWKWEIEHLLFVLALAGISFLGVNYFQSRTELKTTENQKEPQTPIVENLAKIPDPGKATKDVAPDVKSNNTTLDSNTLMTLLNNYRGVNNGVSLPRFSPATINEVLDDLRVHGAEVATSRGWYQQETVGKNTVVVKGLIELNTELSKVAGLLGEYGRFREWIESSPAEISANGNTPSFYIRNLKSKPNKKNEFDFELIHENISENRSVLFVSRLEQDSFTLSAEMPEAQTQSLRTSSVHLRLIKNSQKDDKVWAHFTFAMSFTNQVTLVMFLGRLNLKEDTRLKVQRLTQLLEQQSPSNRGVASGDKK